MSLYVITTDNLGFQTYDMLGTSLILTSVMYAAQIHVTPRPTAKQVKVSNNVFPPADDNKRNCTVSLLGTCVSWWYVGPESTLRYWLSESKSGHLRMFFLRTSSPCLTRSNWEMSVPKFAGWTKFSSYRSNMTSHRNLLKSIASRFCCRNFQYRINWNTYPLLHKNYFTWVTF
jgi:hypothetical protein